MTTLQVEIADHLAWITFNRVAVANAIDQGIVCALDHALNQVLKPESQVRCIVLAGAGKHFCSGIDLGALRTGLLAAKANQEKMTRGFLDHVVDRLLTLRVPIVAAVNGAAAGSGMSLALTADVLVMSEDAYLLPSFTRLGLVPDSGSTFLLAQRIGAARARTVLMLGERIDAAQALEWGLAYQVVPPAQLHEAARKIALRIASGPPRVLGATRALLSQAGGTAVRQQLHLERTHHTEALAAREYAEGIAAFFEDREPKY